MNTDLIERLESLIHSYENDQHYEEKEAVKHQAKSECFGLFVTELKDILNEMKSKGDE